MYQTLDYVFSDGIGELTLNRPDRLNAISPLMVEEMQTLLAKLSGDDALRVLIVTGSGRVFSAGADISALESMQGTECPYRFLREIQSAFNALEGLPVPSIAAVNGGALGGGCELALACDLRIMAEHAVMGVPEVKLGLLPGAGGTQRLSRLLPMTVAKEMIYLGEPVDAQRARELDLVNAVVNGDELLAEARACAARLRDLAPLALRAAKMLVHGAALRGLGSDIEAERQTVAYLFQTEDAKEGIQAFLDKRAPTFSGR